MTTRGGTRQETAAALFSFTGANAQYIYIKSIRIVLFIVLFYILLYNMHKRYYTITAGGANPWAGKTTIIQGIGFLI